MDGTVADWRNSVTMLSRRAQPWPARRCGARYGQPYGTQAKPEITHLGRRTSKYGDKHPAWVLAQASTTR